MNCNEARKWLSPYLDSELDPSKTFEISQHLERCPACHGRFEQERTADQLIGQRLKADESYFDWHTVQQQITSPVQRLFSLRPMLTLAAAACIAFVLVGIGTWPQETYAENPAQWAIDELHELSPDCGPFQPKSSVVACSRALSLEVLDRPMTIPGQCGDGDSHRMNIVDVHKRFCPKGRPRVEVHLNCCGRPVLLTVGRVLSLGELESVFHAIQKVNKPSLDYQRQAYGTTYFVAAKKITDVVIVAVSPHPVDTLVNSIALGK